MEAKEDYNSKEIPSDLKKLLLDKKMLCLALNILVNKFLQINIILY